ncbi:MAG: hypothetical protein R2764_20435 [Bacteroidales bacterium]
MTFSVNFSCSLFVHGQIGDGGYPPGLDSKYTSDSYDELIVLPPSMDLISEEDLQNDIAGRPDPLPNLFLLIFQPVIREPWRILDDGNRLWRLKLSVSKALALALYFDAFELPDGVRFFVYDHSGNQVLGAFTSSNNHESGLFATALIIGEELTMELFVPKDSTEKFRFHVSDIAYGYRNIPSVDGERGLPPGFCEVNVRNCSPEGDDMAG